MWVTDVQVGGDPFRTSDLTSISVTQQISNLRSVPLPDIWKCLLKYSIFLSILLSLQESKWGSTGAERKREPHSRVVNER